VVKCDLQNAKVSWLGLGAMRLPTLEGEDVAMDWAASKVIVDTCIEAGINYFDTAFAYNKTENESVLGASLKGRARESYFIATKYAQSLDPDYKAVFESQLERLNTDYIDFYHIHSVMDLNYQKYIDSGCIEYFAEQKAAGRIKYLGFSTHSSPEIFEKFLDYRDWDFVLMQLNAYDWVFGPTKKKYEMLEERKIPSIAMGPIRGGRIATLSPEAEAILKAARPEWSLTEWAFRWVKNRRNNKVVLSGMGTVDMVNQNARIFNDAEGLTPEEEAIYFKAIKAFKKEMTIPCTDCKYCIDNDTCPQKINIPKFLDIYNAYKVDGAGVLRKMADIEGGQAMDCIGCGECTAVCPQNIDLVPIILELAKHNG